MIGHPAIGMGLPADWPRLVRGDVEQLGGLAGVVVEELVEVTMR